MASIFDFLHFVLAKKKGSTCWKMALLSS